MSQEFKVETTPKFHNPQLAGDWNIMLILKEKLDSSKISITINDDTGEIILTVNGKFYRYTEFNEAAQDELLIYGNHPDFEDEEYKNSFNVSTLMNVNVRQLRKNKLTLLGVITQLENNGEKEKATDLEGILHFIDGWQDEAAKSIDENLVFNLSNDEDEE